MEATVTPDGLLQLPDELRQKLGLQPGMKVNFVERSDGTFAFIPYREHDDPFARWVGAFPLPEGTSAVEWARGLRDPLADEPDDDHPHTDAE